MYFNRHVLKVILGRSIRFHDLAFFDPIMYESLRQLVLDAESKDKESLFSSLDLNFRYILSTFQNHTLTLNTLTNFKLNIF